MSFRANNATSKLEFLCGRRRRHMARLGAIYQRAADQTAPPSHRSANGRVGVLAAVAP